MNTKKINATEGREESAGKRFKEIREIIIHNSSLPFKAIIGEIADISPGGYYNYTSENSSKYGRVSLYTVKNMSSFFNLPQGIFDCTLDFDEEAKKRIATIIKTKFNKRDTSSLALQENATNNIITQLKDISKLLSAEENLEALETSLSILESTINIVKDKIKIIKL